MQKLMRIAAAIYIAIYCVEGPIRYALSLVNADMLIFARDALIALPMLGIACYQFALRRLHPAFFIFLFVVVFHGVIMIANMDSAIAVAYMAKALMGMVFGALLAPWLLNPPRWMAVYFLLLWCVVGVSVGLDKYAVVEFPWAGMTTEIGDVQVDVSKNWEQSDASATEEKRAAGLTRSSINAAMVMSLLAIVLLFQFRHYLLRLILGLATLAVLYWTTQKGAMLAFAAIFGLIMILPKYPVFTLRLGFIGLTAAMIGLPLIMPGLFVPSGHGQLSLYSFSLRVNDTWPDAWAWIRHHEAFPFGVGLGGIGGAQRFYAETFLNPADNLFIFLYANFGLMALIYLGWQMTLALRLRNHVGIGAQTALALATFLTGYGAVLSILEDQMAALFWGAALATLAQAVKGQKVVRNVNGMANRGTPDQSSNAQGYGGHSRASGRPRAA